jgi:hypothetical protein
MTAGSSIAAMSLTWFPQCKQEAMSIANGIGQVGNP